VHYALVRVLLGVSACVGIAVVYLLPLSYVVAAAAGLVASVVIFRYPVAGLCLLGFAVPWGSSLPVGSGSLPLTPTDIIAAEVGATWLVGSGRAAAESDS